MDASKCTVKFQHPHSWKVWHWITVSAASVCFSHVCSASPEKSAQHMLFPNANKTPKTKQKMPQQFQFLGNCRTRGAGQAGARLRRRTWTQDVGTAFISEPLRCTRTAHPENSLLRKRRGRMGAEDCSFLPGGSIRNTVSLTPDADLCHSESRLNIQWSPYCIQPVCLTRQNYLFIFSLLQRIVRRWLISIKILGWKSKWLIFLCGRYGWFISYAYCHLLWFLSDLASEKWHCWLSVTCKISVSIWKNDWRKEVEIIF